MRQASVTREEANMIVVMARTFWSYFIQVIPNVDDLPSIERTEFENTVRPQHGNPGLNRLFFEYYVKQRATPTRSAT